MLITVEATYEGGVLKLREPLPLAEHETVQVTVQTESREPTGRCVPQHDPARVNPVADVSAGDSSTVADEPSESNDWEMVDIFLKLPPSPTARIVTATRGEIWPSPYVIVDSDLTPE